MNSYKNRLLIGAALLIALGLGYCVAQFMPHAEHEAHAEDGDHASYDEGHEESGEHDGHDEREGEWTEEGVVELTEQQIKASGIGVVNVSRGGGSEYRLSGRVEPAVDAKAIVAVVTSGRVEQILTAPGTSVEVGQSLAIIVSGEAATLRANADAAVAEAEAAQLVYQRDLNLVAQGIVARQEMEASRARSLAADAAARAAQAQVAASGSPDTSGRLTINSPIAGIVSAVNITTGGVVTAGGTVAEIVDPGRVELVFNAPPALASEVITGTRIQVTGASRNFEAVVIGVAANAREQSGATLIRARSTTGDLPPAGSPVTAIVVTDRQEAGLAVPADAVQTVEGQSVVFVVEDSSFRATPVLVGRRVGDFIEILNGLSGDERIAGTNAFLLKAELAKGETEHGH